MRPRHSIEISGVESGVVEVDSSLTVVTAQGDGYIYGNAHSHPGLFLVWFPEERHGFGTSLQDIVTMSDEAARWIEGFLAGNEPTLEEYLGIREIPLELRPEPTEAEYRRWLRFTHNFRRTGYSPSLNERPVSPLVLQDFERAEMRIEGEMRPWALAGERVWVPALDSWVEAEPQPELVDGEMPGTLCAARGEPDVMELQAGWSICLDCAQVFAAY